jgi:hypothetical protein
MRRTWLVVLSAAAAVAACAPTDLAAVLYYNFEHLETSADGTRYRQRAELGGATIADLGCFVVESRQVHCLDATQAGEPNDSPAVVECVCPCAVKVPDPCAEHFPELERPPVTEGTIRGVVDYYELPQQYGGVEFPTAVALDDATEIFILQESDAAPGATAVVLHGELARDGAVLRGALTGLGATPAAGAVTIAPITDGALL